MDAGHRALALIPVLMYISMALELIELVMPGTYTVVQLMDVMLVQ
jgi:hypothetical protein